MRIYVNSVERDVPEPASVQSLIEWLQLMNKRVAVEVNTELVTKSEWPGFKLKSGDRVEIVSFVGGG